MKRPLLLLALLLFFPTLARAAAPALESGDHVAVIGDSITEQKQYSVLIEDYLLMCQPAANLRVTQFGWGGETAGGFLGRMDNDLLPFHPTAATTCYGMNDGGYSPMNPDKARGYEENQRKIVERLKKAGVRLIVVGSPGCVDADTFHNHTPSEAVMYNKTLAAERDISRKVAESEGVVFADVFDPMVDVMTHAKAKYGRAYPLAGGDGVHPGPNGHLVMAYAMLKALGCTGDIGRITVDLAADKAEATAGTTVVSCHAGTIELESTRYPFCFFGDPASPDSTRGVLEWLPFNKELNRYELVVHGGKPAGRYKVTWGTTSKEFSAEQLSTGINLAAEFLDNPFSAPFQKAEGVIRNQQNAETPLVKNLLHTLPEYKQLLPDEANSFARIPAAIVARDKVLAAESTAAVAPVKHRLKIEAE
jgi:lysophospholipase L1-like esterase